MEYLIIKTKRFTLRYPDMNDLESFRKNINDKKISEMIPEVEYPCKIKTARQILKDAIEGNKKGNKENFVIDINGLAIGAIGLTKIVGGHKAEIWSWIGKDYRGKGIMTQAHKAVVSYAFKKYHLRRIYGTLLTKNVASARMLEKVGFKKEALLRKNAKIKGKLFDEFVYAKVK